MPCLRGRICGPSGLGRSGRSGGHSRRIGVARSASAFGLAKTVDAVCAAGAVGANGWVVHARGGRRGRYHRRAVGAFHAIGIDDVLGPVGRGLRECRILWILDSESKRWDPHPPFAPAASPVGSTHASINFRCAAWRCW